MNAIPISASPDAVDWITEALLQAQAFPDLAGLTPVLHVGYSQTVCDAANRITEHYEGTFFNIGWDRAGEMAEWPVVAIGLSGLKLRASPDVLRQLEGKQLVLRTVETGWPIRAKVKHPMLKAIVRER